jgi:hypothetical protein
MAIPIAFAGSLLAVVAAGVAGARGAKTSAVGAAAEPSVCLLTKMPHARGPAPRRPTARCFDKWGNHGNAKSRESREGWA